MFGLLVSLFDLGVLAHGTIKNEKEDIKNKDKAKACGRSWYITAKGENRLVKNNHRASVTAEGVRDLVTGELIEDYNERNRKIKAESDAKWKKYEEDLLRNSIEEAKKTGNVWALCPDMYYHNLKNGLKAHEYGYRRFPGALYEDEFRYYVDNRLFHYNHTPNELRLNNVTFTTLEQDKKEFIKTKQSSYTDDKFYNQYVNEIKYNNEIFKKYNNKDFIDKYGIELVPVSKEDFIKKFDEVE